MTYASSPSCSVLMSKFMRASPRISLGVARSLTRRTLSASVLLGLFLGFSRRRRELLDQLPDLRRRRRVRVDPEVRLVGGDRGLRVARGLRGLCELELRVRVVRLELRELLVRADRVLVREERLRVEVVRRGVRLVRGGLLDRARPERLAELSGRLEG